jgi:hypothetical protein
LWPTLLASDGSKGPVAHKRGNPGLAMFVRMYPTLTASMTHSTDQDRARFHSRRLPTLAVSGNYNRKGASSKSADGLATVAGGPLSPTWCEWFMGFPAGWTELKASEMQSSPRSRNGSAA